MGTRITCHPAAARHGGDPRHGGAGGAGGELAKAAAESLRGATARLEEAVEREKAAELERIGPELSAKLDRLIEEVGDARAVASDVAATMHAWSRAWDRTGHAKKRRILMASLLKSFDREAYEEGLTLRLFRILEELDYPEIRFLATEFELRDGERVKRGRLAAWGRHQGNVSARNFVPDWAGRGTRAGEMCRHLADHHLVRNAGSGAGWEYAEITWLGERLLALCADSEALARVWPEPTDE